LTLLAYARGETLASLVMFAISTYVGHRFWTWYAERRAERELAAMHEPAARWNDDGTPLRGGYE
jgi:hypothetical protein